MVQLFRTELLVVECRHGAEAEAHLRFHQESRQRFVVQRRAKTAFAAWMALMTVPLKDESSLGCH